MDDDELLERVSQAKNLTLVAMKFLLDDLTEAIEEEGDPDSELIAARAHPVGTHDAKVEEMRKK